MTRFAGASELANRSHACPAPTWRRGSRALRQRQPSAGVEMAEGGPRAQNREISREQKEKKKRKKRKKKRKKKKKKKKNLKKKKQKKNNYPPIMLQ